MKRKEENFRASDRLELIIKDMQLKYHEREGKKFELKEIVATYFLPSQRASFGRWRKEYDRFPPAVMKKLLVFRKLGYNVPDYFQLLDAPMLIGDEKPKVMELESVKELVAEVSDKGEMKMVLEKLEELIALQKKNNALLQENNRLRKKGKDI